MKIIVVFFFSLFVSTNTIAACTSESLRLAESTVTNILRDANTMDTVAGGMRLQVGSLEKAKVADPETEYLKENAETIGEISLRLRREVDTIRGAFKELCSP